MKTPVMARKNVHVVVVIECFMVGGILQHCCCCLLLVVFVFFERCRAKIDCLGNFILGNDLALGS